jgi:hydrogenase nickel incorporation protein HypA/HybF
MHELSVCQGLLSQCEHIAAERGAGRVSRIVLQVGPLSGVEPKLLADAFPIASAGGIADGAELRIEDLPIRVRCRNCETESEATSNNLTCRHCGDWQTQLIGGDELLLASLELEMRDNNEREDNHV